MVAFRACKIQSLLVQIFQKQAHSGGTWMDPWTRTQSTEDTPGDTPRAILRTKPAVKLIVMID